MECNCQFIMKLINEREGNIIHVISNCSAFSPPTQPVFLNEADQIEPITLEPWEIVKYKLLGVKRV